MRRTIWCGVQLRDAGPGMSDTITVRVRISGRVQGVWYRGWTVDEARRLGLSGWVRNRRDGSVEAVFSGPEHVVRAHDRLLSRRTARGVGA